MCGLAGILSFSDQFPASERDVVSMRDAMVHRGPDDAGVWIDGAGRVAVGHRRLSIIDLSEAGRQPMTNEDGTVLVVFNGEIYNYLELRSRLEQQGHSFRSHTDTETIVHAYEEHGVDFVDQIDGMFAIAVYDLTRRRLVLARDRLGVKPLYYATRPGQLMFSSEIKALLRHPRISPELDEHGAIEYLRYGSTVAPRTIFVGIRKLAPAQRVVVDSDGATVVDTYWNPFNASERARLRDAEPDEIKSELLGHLRRSVALRMQTDVPFGVFLSGGLDSSTNVALVSELQDEPVRTFSIDTRDSTSERDHARLVADHFRTDHTEIQITEQRFAEALATATYFADEPNPDWACVPTLLLAQTAKSAGTTVVQLGEGADEIFHGYREWHLARRTLAALAGSPLPVRVAVAAGGGWLARHGGALAQRAEAVVDVARDRVPFAGGAIDFRDDVRRRTMTAGLAAVAEPSRAPEWWHAAERLEQHPDYAQRMSYVDLQQRLPEMLLMRVDKMTMAASVEGREPFLDRRLVEFALALPPELKYHRGRTKLAMRAAVTPLLPPLPARRAKQGFTTPVVGWLHGELGDRLRAETISSSIRERGLLDYAGVGELWSRFARGEEFQAQRLWRIWLLCSFYDIHVTGARPVMDQAFTPSTRGTVT